MITTAFVKIWGSRVGAIAWNPSTGVGSFEYDLDFIEQNLELSPIHMPCYGSGGRVFAFPHLRDMPSFKGMPGLVADILPDKYGKAIIDNWLARQGRPPSSLNPVETLCFIGQRGMGAVEIEPAAIPNRTRTKKLELESLIETIKEILTERKDFNSTLSEDEEKAMLDILRIGTSAGGARAKAVIAYNPITHDVRSGQTKAPKGYEHWLIKFDGVHDAQFGETSGYGRIEMAYYSMATKAGIVMEECRLLEENGRAHFMTKRFDRVTDSHKMHMQTFCALRHFDFNDVLSYSYEQLFETMRMLGLPYPEADQLYRRMIFNVVSKNCDDHTKNFSFLMDKSGKWSLSPAYDICHAYRPGSKWVSQHALSINGKRKEFTLADMLSVADSMNIKHPKRIIEEVTDAVQDWDTIAAATGVNSEKQKAIKSTFVTLR